MRPQIIDIRCRFADISDGDYYSSKSSQHTDISTKKDVDIQPFLKLLDKAGVRTAVSVGGK